MSVYFTYVRYFYLDIYLTMFDTFPSGLMVEQYKMLPDCIQDLILSFALHPIYGYYLRSRIMSRTGKMYALRKKYVMINSTGKMYALSRKYVMINSPK